MEQINIKLVDRNLGMREIKNLQLIAAEIKHIGNDIFADCIENLREVIVTDRFAPVGKNLDEAATAMLVTEKDNNYSIVVNYNKIVLNNGELSLYTKNALFHEFQHLKDKCYDSYIAGINASTIQEKNAKVIGTTFFKEFNASYKAQLYEPITWESNFYSLDTFSEWCKKSINGIKTEICKYGDLESMKNNIDYIAEIVLNFNHLAMYKIALACGANCGDNEEKGGGKLVTARVSGIDATVDECINTYIDGLNHNLESNEKIIHYAINNCMGIYDLMNQFCRDHIDNLARG